MFNLEANVTTEDIIVNPVRQITHKNLNADLLILAHDITVANILKPIDPKLQMRLSELPKDYQGAITATRKGIEAISKGLPFTVNIVSANYAVGGRAISTFAIRSKTRSEIIYTPTDFECQCEGHLNHGVCWHRALRRVFNNYVALLAAQETFVATYAKIGVALTPPAAPEPFMLDLGRFEAKGIMAALDEMLTREAR